MLRDDTRATIQRTSAAIHAVQSRVVYRALDAFETTRVEVVDWRS